MSLRLCRHFKQNGVPCGSPALRGQSLCYFHHRDQQYRLAFSRDRRRAEVCDWKLPPLHTMADIRAALQRVASELFVGRLDPDRAAPMLHALDLAAIPLRQGSRPPKRDP